MWYSYFDAVFCVSLPRRADRRREAEAQIVKYDIPCIIYDAINNPMNGAQGLVDTMKKLFRECLEKGIKRPCVLEDDFSILLKPSEFNHVMNSCVMQLKQRQWDLLYLGGNNPKSFARFDSDNLIPVYQCYSSHAVCYNSDAMEIILKNIDKANIYDNFLVKYIQSKERSFISYPLLVSQRTCFSDITKKTENYSRLIEDRYNKNVAAIKKAV